VIEFLISLYPARWRDRYGDEFRAILEERPLGPFDVADIILGALDAQLRLRGRRADHPQGRSLSVSLRIGGLAAIIGPAIIVLTMVASGGLGPDSSRASWDVVFVGQLVGLSALLVALTGLSAFQARSHPGLVWKSFGLTAIGAVAMLVAGSIDLAAPSTLDWTQTLFFAGTGAAALGSALFGIATRRISMLSHNGATLLVAGPILAAAGFVLSAWIWTLGYIFVKAATFTMLGGWVTLGIAALRVGDRRPSLDRPDDRSGNDREVSVLDRLERLERLAAAPAVVEGAAQGRAEQ
jgi:hypothetical protein